MLGWNKSTTSSLLFLTLNHSVFFSLLSTCLFSYFLAEPMLHWARLDTCDVIRDWHGLISYILGRDRYLWNLDLNPQPALTCACDTMKSLYFVSKYDEQSICVLSDKWYVSGWCVIGSFWSTLWHWSNSVVKNRVLSFTFTFTTKFKQNSSSNSPIFRESHLLHKLQTLFPPTQTL